MKAEVNEAPRLGEGRFFNMREAGAHLGQSYRWMQRNYVYLIRSGVFAFRVPKDSPKGHLMFEKGSLDRYLESCRLVMPSSDDVLATVE